MLEVLNREAGTQEIKDKARAISGESLEVSRNMSEVIWALNSRNDNLESLLAYIRKYAGNYFENSPIRFQMTVPPHVPQIFLSSERRRNLFYAVKEALHNIVKHARATEAEIIISLNNQVLSILIRDNGIGITESELNRYGNGIIHMRTRLQGIGGEFSMENAKGTRIMLSLPV
jgi:signal transduction histidine kinase